MWIFNPKKRLKPKKAKSLHGKGKRLEFTDHENDKLAYPSDWHQPKDYVTDKFDLDEDDEDHE